MKITDFYQRFHSDIYVRFLKTMARIIKRSRRACFGFFPPTALAAVTRNQPPLLAVKRGIDDSPFVETAFAQSISFMLFGRFRLFKSDDVAH